MTISLVTGGCGFIGRHLVAALLQRGEGVRVLDIADPVDLPRGSELVRASALDRPAVDGALQGVDRVYHLAGIAHLWAPDRAAFDRVNRQGTETLLAAAKAAGVKRVVHCSTESILLPKVGGAGSVDEARPPALGDMPGPYTRSKHRAEQAALAAAGNGMDVVVVNPTVPIGPGDRNMTPPATMLSLFLNGSSPFFLDCTLNLVDVRDLAAGMILAAERGRSGERYILGGENVGLRQLLARLEKLSGRPMPKRSIPSVIALSTGIVSEWLSKVTGAEPVASSEAIRIALRSAPFDSAKAKRELGYTPRPIDEALAAAVNWLTDKRLTLPRQAA
jgi:dihydroflavonol-4-reductase